MAAKPPRRGGASDMSVDAQMRASSSCQPHGLSLVHIHSTGCAAVSECERGAQRVEIMHAPRARRADGASMLRADRRCFDPTASIKRLRRPRLRRTRLRQAQNGRAMASTGSASYVVAQLHPCTPGRVSCACVRSRRARCDQTFCPRLIESDRRVARLSACVAHRCPPVHSGGQLQAGRCASAERAHTLALCFGQSRLRMTTSWSWLEESPDG